MAKATFKYFSSKYDFFNIIGGAIVSGYEGIKGRKVNPNDSSDVKTLLMENNIKF